MDKIDLHSDPDTVPVWSGAFGHVVHGMQPVFVQLPSGQWVNTRLIDFAHNDRGVFYVQIGGEEIRIPDAVKFWNSQTTTPGR